MFNPLSTYRSLTRARSFALLTICAAASARATFDSPPPIVPGAVSPGSAQLRLHSGWSISPAGTYHEVLGDLLLGGVVSPDGE